MRVKRGVKARKRRNRLYDQAKGFRGRSKNTIRQASGRVKKAMQYMYRDRKKKKSEFRSLWISRINAAARTEGLSYGQLIHGLKKSSIELDRKILAQLGYQCPESFKAVSAQAKKAIESN